MCGIVGYIGRENGAEKENGAEIVVGGLKRLEYRGYDSWGLAMIKDGKLNEFANRLSANHRYKAIEYGLKKLSETERKIAKRLAREEGRYERNHPGELVHFDNAKLPAIKGDPNKKREHLHVAVDDYSRYLAADIFPDKTQYSSAIHLEEAIMAMPFDIQAAYSDNGKEYKGRQSEHLFMVTAHEYAVKQSFTKIKTPRTNR